MYVPNAKLYNPRVLDLPCMKDANEDALHDAFKDALKVLKPIQQHPLMHTFHHSLNKALAVASHVLEKGGSTSSRPQKRGVILFAHQMNAIFAKHSVEMLVEYHIPYCNWFTYCNKIAMIGICIKGQVEFYPITYQLWTEEHSMPSPSLPVANLASAIQDSTVQDVHQRKDTMPTPWPPIADSAVAAEAPTTREVLEYGITIPTNARPFHSCKKCRVDADKGRPIYFVAPEYVLYSSSSLIPAQFRLQAGSINNVCPRFVDKFENSLFDPVSGVLEHGNMEVKRPSPGFVDTPNTAFSVSGHISNSSTSSMSNMDPELSRTLGNEAKAEKESVEASEARQEADANPGITTPSSAAENIDRLVHTIESMAKSISLNARRLSSVSAISDGDIELGHAESGTTDCERHNMVHTIRSIEDYLSLNAMLSSVSAISDGNVELGHAETRPT